MKIAIFAAGTGGHIYPALSIAEKFGKENVIFIASNREIEKKIYKNSGFKVSHLNISGFRGKNFLEKILWPFNLTSCVLISIFLLIKYRPQNVLLMGNYISVIGLIASIFLFKDMYIHEQNAILGSANKFSLIFAKKLFTTFPLNETKEHNFGQPVRSAFNTLSYATHSEKEHILVLGGSQGALFFNNQLSEILGNLNLNEKILFQTGEHGKKISTEKRKQYMSQTYWGKPVTGFGDINGKIMIVGLAPAAHGGTRTGRVFTGDKSSDFLYKCLHNVKIANQSNSDHVDDGLKIKNTFITPALKCVPPGDKPLNEELKNCFEIGRAHV